MPKGPHALVVDVRALLRDSKNLQIKPIRTSNRSMQNFATALLAGELVEV
ncbi:MULTISPECIES: hypothetical protein [unclassified Kitasatospora]